MLFNERSFDQTNSIGTGKGSEIACAIGSGLELAVALAKCRCLLTFDPHYTKRRLPSDGG